MEAASFINAIFAPDDVIEFRMLPGAFSRWCNAGDFAAIWPKLIEDNRAQNIYFGPNPRIESGKKTDADTKLARCVWVDIDNFDDLNFVLRTLSEASLPAPSPHGTAAPKLRGLRCTCLWIQVRPAQRDA